VAPRGPVVTALVLVLIVVAVIIAF